MPTVLITGGASGIGLAIARRMVARGAATWLWDRDNRALDRAADELGPTARIFAVDISNGPALIEAEAALGMLPPTHLVNNAGILGRAMELDAIDADEVDRVLAINLRATLMVTSAFLRRRVAHPDGAIVNMSSIAGINGGAKGQAVYGATKGALLSLTAAMARDLAPDLRVNALAPGIIDTDIQKQIYADPQALHATSAAIPLGRVGTPNEVAEAAEWLLFEAGYVTGECIRIAGGRK